MNPSNILIAKKQFSELLALTQLFLLREHKQTEMCMLEKTAFLDAKPILKKGSKPLTQPADIPPALNISTAIPPPQKVTQATMQPIKKPLVPTIENVKESAAANPIPEKKSINLEPISSAIENQVDLSYMQFFKDHFPQQPLLNTIPIDHQAKKIKDAWKIKHQVLPVAILSFHAQTQSLAFLKNIAKAIQLFLAPTCVLSGVELEKNRQWDEVLSTPNLRLIIATDYELYLQPELMKHYRQDKQLSKHFLKSTPLLLLSDLSLYLKKPELKQLLWNAIRTEFAS
jgi:hypothetical protein